ncbi:tyrosine-type recombinase/integrase [Streptosporangium roseum]|uniref:tyrosine-type recombinase/integrase n=1 Tax=Streptosporangium roseum TaxID=2001 RepID=UPI0031E5F085
MHHVRRFLYQSGGVRQVPQRRSARHPTTADREEISQGIAAGQSARSPASRLGRASPTISRESTRNGGRQHYRATCADAEAYRRARRPKPAKPAQQPALRAMVQAKPALCWSPVRIHGKGDSVRTVLLDDRGYVALLKLYLARTGYRSGPLFRASVNGRGGPLFYDSAHHRWQTYCAAAGVEIDIQQLRHAHATELINTELSIEAVRRRLGHVSTETTQLYALLDDTVADAEIRAARRRRDQTTR